MEKKLKLITKVTDLKVNERYSMSNKFIENEYVFVVEKIVDKCALLKYNDGCEGLIHHDEKLKVYEFPFSKLEKELF